MQPVDLFRSRIDAMINLNDPLAVLATRLTWNQVEAAIASKFEHQKRVGRVLKGEDLLGTTQTVIGVGHGNAGRPKLHARQKSADGIVGAARTEGLNFER